MYYKIIFFTVVYTLLVKGQIIFSNSVNKNNEIKGVKQEENLNLKLELNNSTNVLIESHKPRIRKVTDTSDSKPSKDVLNSASTKVSEQMKVVAENVVINVPTNLTSKVYVTNSTIANTAVNENENIHKITQQNATIINAENNTKNTNASIIPTTNVLLTTVDGNRTSNTSSKTAIKTAITVTSSTAKSVTSVTTISTTTSITTTTTTTPKPKKPTVTYGVEDFPDLDGNLIKLNEALQQQSNTLPETSPIREIPNAQPSKEMNGYQINHSRDYIVPIVTLLFILPLVLGVIITAYRRFKDFWSTRHYRRMDFLVDGMYND